MKRERVLTLGAGDRGTAWPWLGKAVPPVLMPDVRTYRAAPYWRVADGDIWVGMRQFQAFDPDPHPGRDLFPLWQREGRATVDPFRFQFGDLQRCRQVSVLKGIAKETLNGISLSVQGLVRRFLLLEIDLSPISLFVEILWRDLIDPHLPEVVERICLGIFDRPILLRSDAIAILFRLPPLLEHIGVGVGLD